MSARPQPGTIRVHVLQSLVGMGGRETHEVPWEQGTTAAALLERFAPALPPGSEPGLAVDGRQLPDDAEIPDGAEVVVAVVPHFIDILAIVITILIASAVSAGISYLMQALTPRPKPPGVPQERGDQTSPSAAWNGVQTSYGQGFTIPVVLGRFVVGGQVIYSDVFASSASGSLTELLRVVLMLSEGPVHRIGDVEAAEIDGLGGYTGTPAGGTIPDHIRVNENLLDRTSALPGARVWLRPGSLDQTPLPTNPFRGATSTFTVDGQLNDAGQESIFSYVGAEEISTIGFVLSAHAGLYQQDQQGNRSAYPVTFELRWRPNSAHAWRTFYAPATQGQTRSTWTIGQQERLGILVQTFGADLQPNGVPFRGPFEIRMRRTTPAGAAAEVSSQVTWRSVAVNVNQPFAYPGCALLGLEILASSSVSGALPAFKVRVDGALVRVWDPVHGFSDYLWDPPASGDFAFMTHPPGRNPAWLACEFLVNKRWGLGAYYDDAKIDWLSFRRWAAYCDGDPFPSNPSGLPRFQFNGALDSPRPGWETLVQICSAGRAAPIWRNGKLGVVYQYRDAHQDGGGIGMPTKAPLQLISSSLCEKVQVRWLPTGQRATAFQFQFLNEELLFAQDVLVEPDHESTLADPTALNRDQWRPEVIQAFGVTNPGQLRREAVFLHRVNRLIRRELSFTCGPWLLAAEVGDLIEFEHDMVRPFGNDKPLVMQVTAGGENVTQVTVDHVVVDVGSMAFVARGGSGEPVHRDITSVTPAAGGTVLGFAAPATIAAGATVVVGLQGKLVETYEIVAINLQRDMRREVRALQWVPEIFDELDADDYSADLAAAAGFLDQPDVEAPEQLATDLSVVPLGSAHRIVWQHPPGRGQARARLFGRGLESDTWFLIGETVAGEIDYPSFVPGQSYEIALVLENRLGAFGPPESGTRLQFTADEFPPFAPPLVTDVHVASDLTAPRVRLDWNRLSTVDLAGYEVRGGDDWTAGRVLYSGTEPGCWLDPVPAHGTVQVAARSRCGLYGPRAVVTIPTEASPWPGAVVVSTVDYAPALTGPTGTHTNTERDTTSEPGAPFVALLEGETSGTFETAEVDLGYQAPFFLRVAFSAQELDGATVDDWTFGVDSGEARWRTVDARPASAARPGIDWSLLVDDLTMALDDMPGELRAGGWLGVAGSHTLAALESRVYVNGAWEEWAPHVDRAVVCSKWQARVRLARETTQHAARVRRLSLETMI